SRVPVGWEVPVDAPPRRSTPPAPPGRPAQGSLADAVGHSEAALRGAAERYLSALRTTPEYRRIEIRAEAASPAAAAGEPAAGGRGPPAGRGGAPPGGGARGPRAGPPPGAGSPPRCAWGRGGAPPRCWSPGAAGRWGRSTG